jgi:putative transposase
MRIRCFRGADPRSAADPLVGFDLSWRIPHSFGNYSGMTFYRRRLPHIDETGKPVFLTWRLHDSLPPNRAFPVAALNSGQAFAAMDRLLDEARTGSFYLRQPPIAEMIVEAIQYNANILGHFLCHAFVVMPNHVHLLATPAVALPKLTKSLKGITAKRANAMLALTGNPFWQEESYDHLVRDEREFVKIRSYIEGNPVRGGLVREASEYRWSSAGWATGGSPADGGVRPTSSQKHYQTPMKDYNGMR